MMIHKAGTLAPRRTWRSKGKCVVPWKEFIANGVAHRIFDGRIDELPGPSRLQVQVGQRLLLDIRIDVGDCDATITDRIEDTIDYGQVCEAANLVAQQRSYKTLERLCTAIADRLLERFEAVAVWVKAAKPEPPLPLPVGEVSVEVWREA